MLINKREWSVDLPALLGDVELDLQLLLLQLIAAKVNFLYSTVPNLIM
jgi:hypothetical protein